MVQFPPSFVQLDRYPGYYWNVDDQQLYSIKSGVLSPIKIKQAYRGPTRGGFIDTEAGYVISINGQRRKLTQRYLSTIGLMPDTQLVPMRTA